jgi:hypothetical protein
MLIGVVLHICSIHLQLCCGLGHDHLSDLSHLTDIYVSSALQPK